MPTLTVNDLSPLQQRRLARMRFVRARKVEGTYQRHLVGVGRHVGGLVRGLAPEGIVANMTVLRRALEGYSELLGPWAMSVVQRMQAEVSQRDVHAWAELGREVGRSLSQEIRTAPTGGLMRPLIVEQVQLIQSLPLEAARRVFRLTQEGISNSVRVPEIQSEILRTEAVTVGRAKLIARTSVSSTASTMVESRAKHIGSEGYFWRTSQDRDVRQIHRALEGKFVRWDDPPIAGESGERAHAGRIYNCRCWPEPAIPDAFFGTVDHLFSHLQRSA